MSGVNNFSGEDQVQNNHVIPYHWPISEGKLSPSDKVEKSSGDLDGIQEPVVMIR